MYFRPFFAKSMPFYHSSARWTSGYKFDKLKENIVDTFGYYWADILYMWEL